MKLLLASVGILNIILGIIFSIREEELNSYFFIVGNIWLVGAILYP